ncbi:DNA-3-methyladenine glycosylase family protein [Sediminibacillus albus]|uniref:DNA-3-methyladenine glycosylase II n=1 Tax=Sediminibacillus albus TaxID=407036 RepID=A0A1G8YEH2_9BACI|nr:DNA-3-methyladenine glycosylase [Sediminibacillus albus]SDK00615.1 DNA-3-methyladenine glycosylase II [Sediminibacillus albus]
MKSKQVIIECPNDFSFSVNLEYLRNQEDALYITDKNSIKKILVIEGDKLFIRIWEVKKGQLSLEIKAIDLENINLHVEKVTNYVRDWFDLDTNVTHFYHMARKDKFLKDSITKFYGLRIIGIPDLFETFVWAVLGQQINLVFASKLKDRFIKKYGERTVYNGEEYWNFPSPKEIASEDVDELFKIGMSRRKCEYIKEVAMAVVNRKITKNMLKSFSDIESAVNKLIEIKGIGPWTAHYVLLRCVRYSDAFPINDVGLHNAIKLAGNLEEKPPIDKIRKIAAPWKGYEAYATFYLWRLIY